MVTGKLVYSDQNGVKTEHVNVPVSATGTPYDFYMTPGEGAAYFSFTLDPDNVFGTSEEMGEDYVEKLTV